MKRTCCLLLILIVPFAGAEDWPFYRGARFDGVSIETGWKPWTGKPDIAWTKELGIGASSFTVVGDQVFTTGNKDGRDIVYCLDVATGKEVWTHDFACKFEKRMFEGGTASTPTVHEGRVYNLSYDGQLHCLNVTHGAIIWRKHLLGEFGGKLSRWKYAGSPLVVGDRIIIDAGGSGNSTLALSTSDGSRIWGTGNESAGYSTPIPYTRTNGKKAVLVFKGKSMLAHDWESGEQLWRIPWKTSYDVNASSPTVIGDTLFISSGYKDGRGEVYRLGEGAPKAVWRNDDLKTKMSSCAVYEGHVYGISEKRGMIMCLELKSGKPAWQERGGGQYGTLMIAGGKLIILTDAGELKIAEADAGGYKELASGKVLKGRCWVMPVLANGRIFAKTNKGSMVCVKLP